MHDMPYRSRSENSDEKSSTSSGAAGITSNKSSSVVHHFRQNFELSGFGSPGEAFVQTVKELVDNAIDACRWRSSEQDAPTVRVVLRRLSTTRKAGGDGVAVGKELDKDDEPLELQVADNGVGLTDVTEALVLFSSTKSGHTPKSGAGLTAETNAGKYGLGLTLSLLYSQKHFGGFLKVTTATVESPEWLFAKCDIDLVTGQPRIICQKRGPKPDSWAQGCGTDMRLLVPGGEDALHYAEPRLKSLLSRMHLSPERAAGVAFTCEGCLGGLTIFVPRGGREASPSLLVDNQDLVRAFARGLTAMTEVDDQRVEPRLETVPSTDNIGEGRRAFNVDDHYSDQEAIVSRRGSAVTAPPSCMGAVIPGPSRRFADEDIAVFECQGRHGTRVTAAIAVDRPRKDSRERRNASRQTGNDDKQVPLFVHRLANGVPMLDTNTSSACALVAGVSKAGWRSLGLKIMSSRIARNEGKLRFVLSEAPTPLKVKEGAKWSALGDIKAVHVSVAANSESIPYTSLRKDCIAHREGYVPATSNAVQDGLASLSNRTVGGFCSALEASKEMMEEDLLPRIASSVASMVNRSLDVSFQKSCLAALGVGNEYVQEKRLEAFLQTELLASVREEEQRRYTSKVRAASRTAEKTNEKNAAGPIQIEDAQTEDSSGSIKRKLDDSEQAAA